MYNEDRISIVSPILEEKSVKCSYFAVYDGHGGSWCANFLRDNLHDFVISDPEFLSNPKKALRNGFEKAEQTIMSKIGEDKSGSCAAAVLLIGDTCYVANVGDSRVIISG